MLLKMAIYTFTQAAMLKRRKMTTFEILAEKNKLTITESGAIKLNPLSTYEFITYPLNDELKTIELTQDEYYGLLLKVYQFDENLDGVVTFDPIQFTEFKKAKFAMMQAEQKAKAVENGSTD